MASCIYQEKNKARNKVKHYLNHCRASFERARIQKLDAKFHSRDQTRFQKPGRQKDHPKKIRIGEIVTTDSKTLLDTWRKYFGNLASSQAASTSELREMNAKIDSLYRHSFIEDDVILDYPVTIEEVEGIVSRLRRNKASGKDEIAHEHLKFGGEALKAWLCQIFNAIISQEIIPSCLKQGIVIPCYKVKGKDPLIPTSYRGITLLSVINKVLEKIILNRMRLFLEELGIPHRNQTAYQTNVSCADAIFATHESVAYYLRHGNKVFACFYDLEKDPLLRQLEELSLGLNIRNLYLGSFAHADDLHSFCNNKRALQIQAEFIESYMIKLH